MIIFHDNWWFFKIKKIMILQVFINDSWISHDCKCTFFITQLKHNKQCLIMTLDTKVTKVSLCHNVATLKWHWRIFKFLENIDDFSNFWGKIYYFSWWKYCSMCALLHSALVLQYFPLCVNDFIIILAKSL